MGWNSVIALAKSDYAKLVPILAFAFYMAFIPHQSYPYPVHIDEWMHLAHSQALLKAGSITFTDPFLGQSTMSLGASNMWVGYHVFWGVFHQISGISWLAIFRYFPGIIFIITVLSVYVLARREGFGWEAALLTCLMITTVGILGPGFLVPVAMGLLFIPLSLFLVFNFRTWWSYVVLFIFTSFLLAIHATTAVGLVIILIPYILLNLKGNFKHSLYVALAMAIPFLVPFPWIFKMLLPAAKKLLALQPLHPYIELPRIINKFGYVPSLLCLVGTFLLALRGGRKSYGLLLGLLALLIVLVAYFTFHYGLSQVYTRGLLYMMLMISIVAGAGLMAVRNLRLPSWLDARLKVPAVTQNVGKILCVALIALILTIAIPARYDTPYYHMINEEDYQTFVWIRDNVDAGYDRAILDPWKATAFAAITGKHVYTRIHTAPQPSDEEAQQFLANSCNNTSFLKEKGISIVYTLGDCDNPDLVEQEIKHVYLFKGG